jgi:hypothetical protein
MAFPNSTYFSCAAFYFVEGGFIRGMLRTSAVQAIALSRMDIF